MTAPSIDTLSDYLDAAVSRYVPASLVSRAALADIQEIAKLIPGTLSGFFGFECPLGVSRPAADFLICVSADDGGREVLAGMRPGGGFPPNFQSNDVWRRVHQFGEIWNDASSSLFDTVHNIWLEFDISGALVAVPEPSVFLGSDQLRSDVDPGWLVNCALPVLTGGTLEADAEAAIRRCISQLPKGAKIFQIGRMLGRRSTETRLCARGIPSSDIVDYLSSVGWKGSRDDLGVLIDQLSEQVQRIDLDIDVNSCVMPKLGLECYPSSEPVLLQKFLDYFASAGFCTREKGAQLGAWIGLAHQSHLPDIWPRGLQRLSSFLDGRCHSTFLRWLHHVKIVYQPGFPLHAKAYLAVKHQWLSPALLKAILRDAGNKHLSSRPDASSVAEEKSFC